MDLGASICTRTSPNCADCPLTDRCMARRTNVVEQIPAPRPKRDRPQREVVFIMVLRDGDVLLQKRPDSGVWGGLWCFPETVAVNGVAEWCENRVGMSPDRIEVRPKIKHAFGGPSGCPPVSLNGVYQCCLLISGSSCGAVGG